MKNGQLSYTDDFGSHSVEVYIEEFTQALTLSGTTAQLRLQRQFYPKAFSPSNAQIKARATSQDEYQTFSKFVRDHHITMVNTPGSMSFATTDSKSPGYNRLMQLYVVGEDILWRGWIPSFTLSKKGVFEPAPQFSFEFFMVFDLHSTNIMDSRVVRSTADWWNAKNTPIPKATPTDTKTQTKAGSVGIIDLVDPSLGGGFLSLTREQQDPGASQEGF